MVTQTSKELRGIAVAFDLLGLLGGNTQPCCKLCDLCTWLIIPELRDRVYHFAVKPSDVELIKRSLLIRRNASRRAESTATSTDQAANDPVVPSDEWASNKRRALGLTQFCQQLRSEVLPLHRAAHCVRITVQYEDEPGIFQQSCLRGHIQEHRWDLRIIMPEDPLCIDLLRPLALLDASPRSSTYLDFHSSYAVLDFCGMAWDLMDALTCYMWRREINHMLSGNIAPGAEREHAVFRASSASRKGIAMDARLWHEKDEARR
ncbi:hypothetical protein EK21DRAFT_89678 [Setomelanomma holmii]|uniref:Uncharacterized protein n=1 Tax=Setomelanomma holmii TaxID=210430 RepID=A0A9P4H9Y6_9PLEO|nr:hypothetical protein EK21DRAFT_89678 [Setomelanomma holmii]